MTFGDGVGGTIEITRPLFGYKSIINFPFHVVNCEDSHSYSYDPGTSYDVRYCDCTFELDATEQAYLIGYINNTMRASAAVEMVLPADSGFHPFCPDKGDAGTFTVALEHLNSKGIGEAPYLYFHTDLRITNQGAYPAYSLPTEYAEGSLTIGSVSGIRFPENWFEPETEYAICSSTGRGGTVSFLDRGSYGDGYNTRFTLVSNESKMAKLIEYLSGTARAASFQIITSSNYYAFNYEKGSSNTYNVKLVQDSLVVANNGYNEFSVDINLNWISTV